MTEATEHTHPHYTFCVKTVLMKDFPFLKFSLWQFFSIDYPLILSSSFSKQVHLKRYKKGTFQGKFKFLKFLTEAEDIKKRWQEYTEGLYKKDLHDPDNHDAVITHLEPDILECGRPGFDPWVRKIPLEKEMASHSSFLAWRIPWTEEPGRL